MVMVGERMRWLDLLLDAFEDVLDGEFILSDLVDIHLTEAEKMEHASYDALACVICDEHGGDDFSGSSTW